ncbi:MAG: dihydropteroate synthase [Bacteroidia bacterium]|nr:dihydropteroate synthase [Bacteroidia bacterium]NNM22858.1 dihydropteroate synthase [Flavobacteriaceae bacterium]
MGIINVTPDSFYDGGKTVNDHQILARAQLMLEEGATFLDVGGYSSRPGAVHISETEEMERVIPAISSLMNEFPEALISVDTFRASVAKEAVACGAAMINDISAGLMDKLMLHTVAELQVPYILMNMKGTPQTMRSLTQYEQITRDVVYYFSERLAACRKAGINDLIVDPGFGFSKTAAQSFELLNQLELLRILDLPLLVGVSRKSMIYKTLGVTSEEALNGTTALHAIAVLKGATILRVHDVKEAVECVSLVEKVKASS